MPFGYLPDFPADQPSKSLKMNTIQINWPDALARAVASTGLLAPSKIERVLQEQWHIERAGWLKHARR